MTTISNYSQKRFSFALFFLLFYLAWTLRGTVLYSVLDSSFSSESARIVFSNLVKILLWLIPALIYVMRIDRGNPWKVLRINTPLDWRGVQIAELASLIFFLATFTLEYFIRGRTLLPLIHATPLAMLKELAVVFLSPVTEEIFFRGLVLSKFLENHWLPIANILQSLLFTAVHWPNWIWTQGLTSNLIILSISIFVLGLLLGWIAFRTNSIWPAIGIHILNNFLAAFLG